MKLSAPFIISSRLAPAVNVGGAIISYLSRSGHFAIDLPDGSEHIVTDLRRPQGRVRGVNDTEERMIQCQFGALLSFLGACAESRQYATRTGRTGENADLFPENVGEWAEMHSDEIACLGMELEETADLISE
jgi:hypothetical protein